MNQTLAVPVFFMIKAIVALYTSFEKPTMTWQEQQGRLGGL